MIGWSVLVGAFFALALLALGGRDPARLHLRRRGDRARARGVAAVRRDHARRRGAVFALDGILIGASDTRYLMWSMLAASAVYIPLALLALHQGWGIVGVWAGLAALFAVRLVTLGVRFAGERWALTGAPA